MKKIMTRTLLFLISITLSFDSIFAGGTENTFPWYFEVNGIEKCWKEGITGARAIVEVWDSKVIFDSPLLKGKKYGEGLKSYVEDCNMKSSNLKSKMHGTGIASLIAANHGEVPCSVLSQYSCDKAWIAGVAPNAKIFNREVVNACGKFSSEDRFQILLSSLEMREKTPAENKVNADGDNLFYDVKEVKVVLVNASFVENGNDKYVDLGKLRSHENFKYLLIVAGVGNISEKVDKTNMPKLAGLKFLSGFNVISVGATHQYVKNIDKDNFDTFGDSEKLENYNFGIASNIDNVVKILNFSDSSSNKTVGSAYGKAVDILAPGDKVPILTNNSKAYVGSGTSESTAIVTGALALLASCNPYATAEELKQALLRGADQCVYLNDFVDGGRVLNTYNAMNNFCLRSKDIRK